MNKKGVSPLGVVIFVVIVLILIFVYVAPMFNAFGGAAAEVSGATGVEAWFYDNLTLLTFLAFIIAIVWYSVTGGQQ